MNVSHEKWHNSVIICPSDLGQGSKLNIFDSDLKNGPSKISFRSLTHDSLFRENLKNKSSTIKSDNYRNYPSSYIQLITECVY